MYGKIDDDLFSSIKSEIDFIQTNKNSYKEYNSNLAGNIEEEYNLEKTYLKISEFMSESANEYVRNYNFPFDVEGKAISCYVSKCWVNFQKKHEFNPIHNHGGDLSFVIWIKLPYNMEDELSLPSVKKSNTPRAGTFCFVYTDNLGRVISSPIYADKKHEQTFMLFPASLAHVVYPFYTSDDYRISISGNIRIETEEDLKTSTPFVEVK
jgi:hypothetical protein